jgi:hypothetical protein
MGDNIVFFVSNLPEPRVRPVSRQQHGDRTAAARCLAAASFTFVAEGPRGRYLRAGSRGIPMLYLEKIDVESSCGHKANESPRAFRLRGSRYVVREVTDRWYEGGMERGSPIVNYFKVQIEDGREFLLRYDPSADEWRLCLKFPYSVN